MGTKFFSETTQVVVFDSDTMFVEDKMIGILYKCALYDIV